jgi:hypothetical protein
LSASYPHNSPYAFSENRVIDGVELEGLEVELLNDIEDGLNTPFVWYGGVITGQKTANEVLDDVENVLNNPFVSVGMLMTSGPPKAKDVVIYGKYKGQFHDSKTKGEGKVVILDLSKSNVIEALDLTATTGFGGINAWLEEIFKVTEPQNLEFKPGPGEKYDLFNETSKKLGGKDAYSSNFGPGFLYTFEKDKTATKTENGVKIAANKYTMTKWGNDDSTESGYSEVGQQIIDIDDINASNEKNTSDINILANDKW